MNVLHDRLEQFDQDKVIEIYTQKDQCDIKYVCTTEVLPSTIVADVYYRETPHPEFGNHYFGLFVNDFGKPVIINMDAVEDYDFACVLDDEGNYQYSQHKHDFKRFKNGSMIDGGRHYTRSSGSVEMFMAKDGEFVKL